MLAEVRKADDGRRPVCTRVAVTFDKLATYDVEPSALPDVFASRPVVVFGKCKGTPAGAVSLTGLSGRGPAARCGRPTPRRHR